MAAFRLLDQNPVYFNNDGTVCVGGEIRIYEDESTTPTNAGEGPDLTPDLGATITLDASGRAEDDIWLDSSASYRIRLYNADGEMQWSRDFVQTGAGSGGLTPLDPADGNEDDVYSTDGVDAVWRAIREVPSPAGHSGKYLGTDGESLSWESFAADEEYDADNLPGGITSTPGAAGNMVIGNVMILWGTDTAPTIAGLTTTKAVTFATAFGGTPYYIGVQPVLSSGVTSNSPSGRPNSSYSSPSTSGFTAGFFVGEENNGGTDTITSTIPFTYLAIGPAP